MVELKKYAAAKEIAEDASLQALTRGLKERLDADAASRAWAELDLANTVAQVPVDAADVLTRAWRSPVR